MSSRKLFMLIGAVLVGCVAGYAVMQYVDGVEEAAYEGAERVEVIVIAQDVPAGTTAEDATAVLEVRKVPRDVMPATAITSLDEIAGRVAVAAIPANSILVEGMFADPVVATSSFSQTLPDGLVAISFNFAEAQGVGRWLAPGDRVNIMVRSTLDSEAETAPAEGETGEFGEETEEATLPSPYAQPSRMLYQDVVILSIGQTTVAAPGQSLSDEEAAATLASGLITFAVPADAALRLSSVNEADLYLTLVPPSYTPQILAGLSEEEIRSGSLLPGEDPLALTPYGPQGYDALIEELQAGGGTDEPSDAAFSEEDEVDGSGTGDGATTSSTPG